YADPRDTLFIDAGANVGYFSLLAARQGFDTLAVEMSLENALKVARSAVVHNENAGSKNRKTTSTSKKRGGDTSSRPPRRRAIGEGGEPGLRRTSYETSKSSSCKDLESRITLYLNALSVSEGGSSLPHIKKEVKKQMKDTSSGLQVQQAINLDLDDTQSDWPITSVMNDFPDNSGLYEVYHVLEDAPKPLQRAFSPKTQGYGNAWNLKKPLDVVLRDYIRRKMKLTDLEERIRRILK
ncbi:unnamed protein product, partial [Amoebophrya sp. A25]